MANRKAITTDPLRAVLEEYKRAHKYTCEGMAQHLGLCSGTYYSSKVCDGVHKFSIEEFCRACKILGIPESRVTEAIKQYYASI